MSAVTLLPLLWPRDVERFRAQQSQNSVIESSYLLIESSAGTVRQYAQQRLRGSRPLGRLTDRFDHQLMHVGAPMPAPRVTA